MEKFSRTKMSSLDISKWFSLVVDKITARSLGCQLNYLIKQSVFRLKLVRFQLQQTTLRSQLSAS
jgi:hypothetical protein